MKEAHSMELNSFGKNSSKSSRKNSGKSLSSLKKLNSSEIINNNNCKKSFKEILKEEKKQENNNDANMVKNNHNTGQIINEEVAKKISQLMGYVKNLKVSPQQDLIKIADVQDSIFKASEIKDLLALQIPAPKKYNQSVLSNIFITFFVIFIVIVLFFYFYMQFIQERYQEKKGTVRRYISGAQNEFYRRRRNGNVLFNLGISSFCISVVVLMTLMFKDQSKKNKF